MSTVGDCVRYNLPRNVLERGTIVQAESSRDVPFDIARVYYLYEIPAGSVRGGHAHKRLHQLITCVSGWFTVVVDDGMQRHSVVLNRADQGLYIPTMIWRELVDFSPGVVCVVLASHHYDPDDYIYDYDQFLALTRGAGSMPKSFP